MPTDHEKLLIKLISGRIAESITKYRDPVFVIIGNQSDISEEHSKLLTPIHANRVMIEREDAIMMQLQYDDVVDGVFEVSMWDMDSMSRYIDE